MEKHEEKLLTKILRNKATAYLTCPCGAMSTLVLIHKTNSFMYFKCSFCEDIIELEYHKD